MTKFGYARVSSDSQEKNFSLEVQEGKLMEYGVLKENIRKEVASGTSMDRKVLTALVEHCRQGDELIVIRLDRFARSTLAALNIIASLEEKGVKFVALDLPYMEDPLFRQFFHSIILFFATFETAQRDARQKEGIAKAKAAGKYKGRALVITEAKKERLKTLMLTESLSKKELMDALNLSRTTFYRALKQIEEETKNK